MQSLCIMRSHDFHPVFAAARWEGGECETTFCGEDWKTLVWRLHSELWGEALTARQSAILEKRLRAGKIVVFRYETPSGRFLSGGLRRIFRPLSV